MSKEIPNKQVKFFELPPMQEGASISKVLDKLDLFEQDISYWVSKLMASGMYGREIYDQLVNKTKNTDLEAEILEMEKEIKDINKETLDNILNIDSSVFDSIRADIIAQKISEIKDVPEKIKYIDMFHRKFLYMLGNDELDEEDRIYIAGLFLRQYYSR